MPFERFKETIKLFIPSILILLYRKLRSPQFSITCKLTEGNPWTQKKWIELSKEKLQKIRKVNLNKFMSTDDFNGYHTIICFLANLESKCKPCDILDFGGGTGFSYFKMYPYLSNPKNVNYHVVDSNIELLQIGEREARGRKITFQSKLPNSKFDILYINSSLQYVCNYQDLLIELLQYKPKYIVLTRLIAGDIKTHIVYQNIYRRSTQCVFINLKELEKIFSDNGYELIFKSHCLDEVFDGLYDKSISKDLRINNTVNLIFCLKD